MSTEPFEEAGWANEGFIKPQRGKLAVFFYKKQKQNNFKTAKQERPVFDEVIHIKKIPADMYLEIDRPLRETDKEEFPAEWEKFQRTGESRIMGIPIEHWHSINDTQKAEFKAMKIHTVEQFANLPDSFIQKIMGGANLRRKAQIFVEAGRDAEKMAEVKAEANAKVEAMQKQMDEMKAMIAQMQAGNAAAPRKRGRPAKVQEPAA